MSAPKTRKSPDQPEKVALADSGPGPQPQPDPTGPKAGLEKLRVRKTTVAYLDGGGPTQTMETSTKAGLEKERKKGAQPSRAGREGT